jgi:hypothetical protein
MKRTIAKRKATTAKHQRVSTVSSPPEAVLPQPAVAQPELPQARLARTEGLPPKGIQEISHVVLQQIIHPTTLAKIAKYRSIGAAEQVIDLCLKKAGSEKNLEQIITQLASPNFREIYIHLDRKVQADIEILITPPSLLNTPIRNQKIESEIWQNRALIHKLKTETVQAGKARTRRTWKEVTTALHEANVLKDKTQEQIYWSLKDKRQNPKLADPDKKLLDELFGHNQRGKIKQQVDQNAEVIRLARTTLSWEETHLMLQDFFNWTGTLKQLMGGFARIRLEQEKNKAQAKSENQPDNQDKEAAPEKAPRQLANASA